MIYHGSKTKKRSTLTKTLRPSDVCLVFGMSRLKKYILFPIENNIV